MALLKYTFQKDYFKLGFTSFGEQTSCFLRIRGYDDGSFVCLYSKADRDDRTNLSECTELAVVRAIELLEQDGYLPKPKRIAKSKSRDAWQSKRVQDVVQRIRWIERTPGTDSFSGEESYALVSLHSGPCWSYLDKKSVLKMMGVDKDFLNLDPVEPDSLHDVEFKTDQTFAFLSKNAGFLAQGRSFGMQVEMSRETQGLLLLRYGSHAQPLLENVFTTN